MLFCFVKRNMFHIFVAVSAGVLWYGGQAKQRIEQLEEAILQAQARETQIVEMSQWMTDVNDLLQTRLDADVLASDMPKEFEVISFFVNNDVNKAFYRPRSRFFSRSIRCLNMLMSRVTCW